MRIAIGDVIITPRGRGVVREIERIYGKPRYCVELDDPQSASWPVDHLCCYYGHEVSKEAGDD